MTAIRLSLLLPVALLLSGCAVISVVDTAVSVTSTVVSTTVDVAAGAVQTVAGSSSSDKTDEDCKKKDGESSDGGNDGKKSCKDD